MPRDDAYLRRDIALYDWAGDYLKTEGSRHALKQINGNEFTAHTQAHVGRSIGVPKVEYTDRAGDQVTVHFKKAHMFANRLPPITIPLADVCAKMRTLCAMNKIEVPKEGDVGHLDGKPI